MEVLAFTQSTAGQCLHMLVSPSPSLMAKHTLRAKGENQPRLGVFSLL